MKTKTPLPAPPAPMPAWQPLLPPRSKLAQANDLQNKLVRLDDARKYLKPGPVPHISIGYVGHDAGGSLRVPLTDAVAKQIEALIIEDVETQQRTMQAEFDALWAKNDTP